MTSLRKKLLARISRIGQDDGATLILVLAMISVVSLISLALLTLGETSLRAASKTQSTAGRAYDEDAAMQTGVNSIRKSDYDNNSALAQICPPQSLIGPNLGSTFIVTCEAVKGTGAASGGTDSNTNNTPSSALLTLGGNDQDGGTGIQRSGTGQVLINGQTYSRSAITNTVGTNNAISLSTGQAFARGSCKGTITSDPAAECDTTKDPAGSTDPGYPQPTAGLVRRDIPNCGKGKDAVVEFEPGYYDDAEGLTKLFDTCKTSKHVFWFMPAADGSPGKFYFDFKDGESPNLVGDSIWKIDDKNTKMVAGTPQGWDPNDKKPAPPFPGSCQSPLDETVNGGVEFIFGGRSQLQVLSGSVEICGHYQKNVPSLAVFGATKTTQAAPKEPQTTLLDSATTPTSCTTGFSNPEAGKVKYYDDQALKADIPTGSRGASVCTNLVGFNTTPETIPPGSVLSNATLVIGHTEDATVTSTNFTVTLTPSASGVPIELKTSELKKSTSSTLTYSDITTDLFDEFRTNGYSGSTINYQINVNTGNKPAQVQLDTVQLILDWVPAGVRGQNSPAMKTFTSASKTYNLPVTVQTSSTKTVDAAYDATGTKGADSNCVGATNFPTTGCAFLLTGNTADAQMYVNGTLYAPLGAVELQQQKLDAPFVTNGTIVRKLYLNGLTTASGPSGPSASVLSVAAVSPPSVPLEVYFWSFMCLDKGGCPAIDTTSPNYPYLATDPDLWELIGTSRVRYTNGKDFPQAPGNRDVTVLSWQFISPYERN